MLSFGVRGGSVVSEFVERLKPGARRPGLGGACVVVVGCDFGCLWVGAVLV